MFEIKKVTENQVLLAIRGSMTGDAVGKFEEKLDALQKSNYQTITLDLTNVVDVSSLFIGHILHCHKRLAVEYRTIRICGYQDSVGEILKLLNVDKSIHIEKDAANC